MITIYKYKEDRAMCGNSRGISLLSIAGKVFAKILLNRLLNISENILPESQSGFRSNRSTVDMIFAARQLFEKSREQHRDLYVAFIDLSKAFDSVDRNLLWLILLRSGCTERFVQLIASLHNGMSVRIRVGDDLSDPFEVSRGVKQGCVLAPILFNIYVQCITRLLANKLDKHCQISLNYRMDRNLFDQRKLKAKTKIAQSHLLELQYADDCAMVADSQEFLQTVLSHTSDLYRKLGLNINIGKTEYMQNCAPSSQLLAPLHIDNVPLKEVQSFKYLGSHISSNCHLDDEISYRVQQANRAFGRLSTRVFHNKNLTVSTKVSVYNAIVLSSLLYGSETWTLYRQQMRSLESFHMRSLRRILGVTWKDKVPNTEVLRRTGSVSVENVIHRNYLRWLGHTVRMDDTRLPKQFLYGELSHGTRSAGRPLKRYRDQVLSSLRACHLDSNSFETLARERTKWRSACFKGLKECEGDRLKWLEEQRKKRRTKKDAPVTKTPSYFCDICGRGCLSPLGLFSHKRTHDVGSTNSKT